MAKIAGYRLLLKALIAQIVINPTTLLYVVTDDFVHAYNRSNFIGPGIMFKNGDCYLEYHIVETYKQDLNKETLNCIVFISLTIKNQKVCFKFNKKLHTFNLNY